MNAKTALVAYASTHSNSLPDSIGSNLKEFGWSPDASVKVDYTKGTGANAGSFCLLGTGDGGNTWAVTTNSDATKASACPSAY